MCQTNLSIMLQNGFPCSSFSQCSHTQTRATPKRRTLTDPSAASRSWKYSASGMTHRNTRSQPLTSETRQLPGTATTTERETPQWETQREGSQMPSLNNNNVVEHEFSTCVTGLEREREEGWKMNRAAELGETLVWFYLFFPANCVLFIRRSVHMRRICFELQSSSRFLESSDRAF